MLYMTFQYDWELILIQRILFCIEILLKKYLLFLTAAKISNNSFVKKMCRLFLMRLTSPEFQIVNLRIIWQLDIFFYSFKIHFFMKFLYVVNHWILIHPSLSLSSFYLSSSFLPSLFFWFLCFFNHMLSMSVFIQYRNILVIKIAIKYY